MKKKLFISSLICLLMLFCSTNVFASDLNISALNGAQPLTNQQESRISVSTIETSGTKVTISNAAELKAFRDRVNNGETTLNAELTTDIDLQDENWTPIGTSSNPYSGTFDGKCYAIVGLNVSSNSESSGLFAYTGGAYITDLGVLGKICGGAISGGIVGIATDTYIINCYNFCNVFGATTAGGIAGYIDATYDPSVNTSTDGVSSMVCCCFNAGNIAGYGTDVNFVGGITGFSSGWVTIADCYSTGDITTIFGVGGGIAGYISKYVFIANTYNMSEPNNAKSFGEIVGYATENGGIANSYYFDTGYDPIGLDQSSYQHTIYYSDNYYDMTTQDFVDLLNNGKEEYFVFDKYYINNGLPALYWEQPYSSFDDVSINDWFIAPVNWAVSEGITYGTSDTQFSPQSVCTRAQTVTFLWRAAGSPNPTSGANPFTDVKSGSYYYNAVLWAVENGITAGTSSTTFSPEETVSRAQVVTFLWRTDGSTSVSGATPFTDVTANAYYYNAILWAVENGITYGTSTTTFSPNSGCTRAQIVSFLYRYFVL